MNRALIASLLGITLAGAHSYGTGTIIFSTYLSSTIAPMAVYSNGQPIGSADGFNAELFYGMGSGLSFNQLVPLPSSVTGVGIYVPGAIIGPIVQLPDWTSGPVTFGIAVFNGSDYASSTIRTYNNVTWTEPESVIVPPLYPANIFTLSLIQAAFPSTPYPSFVSPISLIAVPEPRLPTMLGLWTLLCFGLRAETWRVTQS